MSDRTFRNAMGKFATGVTVITTSVDNEVHGMTANAFMSVSLDPKLILISISENARMLEKINKAGEFAVNILSREQQEVSMNFAGQIKDKREVNFDWLNGIPVIKDSLANVACKIHDTKIAGDHTLFIGEVINYSINDGEPLTFYQGKYGELVYA